MRIPSMYWPRVFTAIAELVKHVDQGLCIRPKPDTIPLKLCVRKAVNDSYCCTTHQNDCPIK